LEKFGRSLCFTVTVVRIHVDGEFRAECRQTGVLMRAEPIIVYGSTGGGWGWKREVS
jgi:hypothetical protein